MFKIGFTAGVIYQNNIYFSCSYSNGLYEMNCNTGKCKLLCLFEKEVMQGPLHRSAFIFNNFAWFIPHRGNNIVKVNLDTLEMFYYEIDYTDDKGKDYVAYIISKRINNKLYLLPRSIDTFTIIDTEKDEITHIPGVVSYNEEKAIDFFVNNNELMVFFYDRSIIRKINLQTLEKRDEKCEFEVISLCEDGNDIWVLSSDSSEVYQYDYSFKNRKNTLKLEGEGRFNGALALNEEVLFFPIEAKGFLHINKNELKIYVDEMVDEYKDFSSKMMKLDTESDTIAVGTVGYVIFWTDGNARVVPIDISVEEYISQLEPFINDRDTWRTIYEIYKSPWVDQFLGLSGYLKLVEHM